MLATISKINTVGEEFLIEAKAHTRMDGSIMVLDERLINQEACPFQVGEDFHINKVAF
jgi:hypothetical protein